MKLPLYIRELLIAFRTINSFRRNVRTGMSMQLLREDYSKNNVNLILTPVDNQTTSKLDIITCRSYHCII
jgi:hypothetical protein